METWSDADARELVILLDYCGSGPVQATVKDLARVYNTTEKAFMEWLASILLNSTHPAVMDASKDVITTELDGWSPDDWSGWLRAVCIQAGYPMTANLPSGQGAFPGPVSPQQQTQGTGYVWTLDPAPPPAPAGHTATTAVYQNQAQDEAQGGDESDDSALLGCALNPQLQALTFDALAAHLAQWGFTRERVQHSLARIAYNSNVSLQGLDWNQAWRAIAANEQALSLEAMVDACLAQRLHLYTALANISGTAHVQQIDVANYIITLARHRLNRTYTDPDTAYFDLQRTVVPQPPPNPTRKRQRSQPDDYAPWLLSAALSTDSLREIAQQAEPAGAPTTEAGIEGAIRVLGGKLGLQGTAQEIRQQLQAMEHNGTLQNPNLYTPAAAPPPNAQHALNSLTPCSNGCSAQPSAPTISGRSPSRPDPQAHPRNGRHPEGDPRPGEQVRSAGNCAEDPPAAASHGTQRHTAKPQPLHTSGRPTTERPTSAARPEQPHPHAAMAAQRSPQR
ncbi:hypothetical protein [Streptomyces sp. NBC_01614]|uniref:hypothetical protein n=1 Tax=Streptomyces sp. NBC_01614 TaxID=2975897 RepID=UPI00386AF382